MNILHERNWTITRLITIVAVAVIFSGMNIAANIYNGRMKKKKRT
jgi:hypothetical protein